MSESTGEVIHALGRPATEDEIVALKGRLQHRGLLRHLCATIVTDMLLKEEADEPRLKAEGWVTVVGSPIAETTREEFAIRVGALTADWALTLNTAVQLPEAEWPEHMTPPGEFVSWLADYDAAQDDGVTHG